MVSTVKVTVLLASEPSVLAVLAASVKLPLATEITPLAVLLELGVKVALYEVADAAFQLEREPPDTETSDWMKLVEAFERVKLMVAVSPTPRMSSASSSVMAIVGSVGLPDTSVRTMCAAASKSASLMPCSRIDPTDATLISRSLAAWEMV